VGSFLFLPSVEPGNGTGHLVRALGTASELASISEKNETALYLPREYLRPGIEGILGKFPGLADHLLTDEAAMEGRHWDFTV